MSRKARLLNWWRHLHWFDVYRAHDWQCVIWVGLITMLLAAAYTMHTLH